MFPGFYAAWPWWVAQLGGRPTPAERPHYAVEPLKYIGYGAVAEDIRRLKDAAAALNVELYLPGVAPGSYQLRVLDGRTTLRGPVMGPRALGAPERERFSSLAPKW